MTDLDSIQSSATVTITFEEADLEFALVTWLNQLLGKAREQGLVFNRFHVQRSGDKWHAGLERGVEVKGATLTMLTVKQSGQKWVVRCVVDV